MALHQGLWNSSIVSSGSEGNEMSASTTFVGDIEGLLDFSLLFSGSKLSPLWASLQMARDLFMIRLRYLSGSWKMNAKPKRQ